MDTRFRQAIATPDTVLVSDGGLATELEARGHDLSGGLWSARLLRDDPTALQDVHRAFYQAGAVIATTASYQASDDGFAGQGIGRSQAQMLMRRSVTVAQAARDEVASDGRTRWVAASVGPYGAALADGSEYRGRYGLTRRRLAAWHRPRLEVLAAAGPDVLALETIPDVDEAAALVEVVAELGVPAWLSYTIAGGHTRAGQSLAEAFAVAKDVGEIVAVGVNCCAPEEVPEAISVARAITGKPVIAYPNSGEEWEATQRRWQGPSRFVGTAARQWVRLGARVVGGCCRVRPTDIAALVQALDDSSPPSL